MRKKVLGCGLVLLGFIVTVAVPTHGASVATTTTTSTVENIPSFRATRLVGREVQSVEREPLGAVEDFLIDSRRNALFLVVSYGGFLGLGDKLAAIPWSAIAITEQDGPLLANIDKERFLTAPTFDRESWQQTRNPEYLAMVASYYPKKKLGGKSGTTGNLLPPSFAQLDGDSNGTITLEEAKNSFVLSAQFRVADKNRDSGLNQEEFETFQSELLKAWKGGPRKPVPTSKSKS